MKKTKSLEKRAEDFHRLRYKENVELQEKFNKSNITCGFMREPYYNPTTNEIKGFCYFREQQKLQPTCVRHLPFTTDNCNVYDKYRKTKK